ncbi:MAG: hypothetical protein ACTTNA_01050 [Candidatus Karelsulcia muelleri]
MVMYGILMDDSSMDDSYGWDSYYFYGILMDDSSMDDSYGWDSYYFYGILMDVMGFLWMGVWY